MIQRDVHLTYGMQILNLFIAKQLTGKTLQYTILDYLVLNLF